MAQSSRNPALRQRQVGASLEQALSQGQLVYSPVLGQLLLQ